MLLTGLRNSEAASLDWKWIDEDRSAITLPPDRMKSGRMHAIPLPQLLLEVLGQTPRVSKSSLVFPVRSRSKSWTTMSGFGQMLRRLQRESSTSNWTLYDLRRTFRSMLAELGYDPDLCERMIAHNRGGLVERYDRSTRWPERVDAAKAYSAKIFTIISLGQNSRVECALDHEKPFKNSIKSMG